MKKQNFKVEHKNKSYDCFIDEQGMVWYNDVMGNPTNLGQTPFVYQIDSAKKLILEMFRCSGM